MQMFGDLTTFPVRFSEGQVPKYILFARIVAKSTLTSRLALTQKMVLFTFT
jgi:hypothetical protein